MPSPASEPVSTLPPQRAAVAHAWLASAVFRELEAEADRLNMHPDQLAAIIVDTVVCNGFTDAIMRAASTR